MSVFGVTTTADGPQLSTWLFLGGLAGASAGVLWLHALSLRGYRPPAPRDDLVSEERFLADRPHDPQLDLGRGWTSTDDPYAMWHLWYLPRRRELVGSRMAAMPHPASLLHAPGRVGRTSTISLSFERDGERLPWEAGDGRRWAVTGMKVLADGVDRPHELAIQLLRDQPHGLDRLCDGTRAAPRPATDRSDEAAETRPPADGC